MWKRTFKHGGLVPCDWLAEKGGLRSGAQPAKNPQAPVVQTLDSAIHWINHYPADSVIDFPNTYPLDSAIQRLNNRGQVDNSDR